MPEPNNKISRTLFIWIIGGVCAFAFLLFQVAMAFVSANTVEIKDNRNDMSEVKGDVKVIKNDTANIYKALEDINRKLDR